MIYYFEHFIEDCGVTIIFSFVHEFENLENICLIQVNVFFISYQWF